MKNTVQISGLLTALLLLIGNVFKTFHLPGAGLIITLSIILFVFGFIPLHTVKTFNSENNLASKMKITFGNLLAATAVIGVLFKIMYWPMANILMTSSISLFVIGYIPLNIIKALRSEKDITYKIRTILGNVVVACFATGVLFKIMHWPHSIKLVYLNVAFLILAYIPFYFYSKMKKYNLYNSIINTVYIMVLGGVIYTLIDLSNI